jgi:hypothetical protein
VSWLRRWSIEGGDTHLLGVLRVLLGLLSFREALDAARDLVATGYFAERFHLAVLPEEWVPSRSVYTLLVGARLLLAVMVVAGHGARPALFAGGALSAFVLACDRLSLEPGRWALACFAFLLAFAPCDRALSLTQSDDDETLERSGSLWAQRLLQLQVSIVFVGAGTAMLVDRDWTAGLVLADRLGAHEGLFGALPSAAPLLDLAARPGVASALAKIAIAAQLAVALGLWLRRTRIVALWVATWFLVIAGGVNGSPLFAVVMLASLVLFATPDAGARKLYYDPARPVGALYARLVASLDWLARYEIKPWEPDDIRRGHHLVIVRRDGSRAVGLRAFALVARTTPLLFPLWPLAALAGSFAKRPPAPTGTTLPPPPPDEDEG